MNEDKIFVPEGIKEYERRGKRIDLNLMPGEEVYKVIGMNPLSKIREYILAMWIALFGYTLYVFFKSGMTMKTFIPVVITFLISYFTWHYKVTKDFKHLIWNIIKYSLYIILLGYFITFLTSYLSSFLSMFLSSFGYSASNLPSFSLNPVTNIRNIFIFLIDLFRKYLSSYASILSTGSIILSIISLIMIINIFLYTRGRLYYITNKRIVTREKYGTIQVTTLPIDGIVEVTAFQGLAGRVFGYGDILLSMISGGGVDRSLEPESESLTSGLYSIKRKLEGVKEPWKIKDLILWVREKYVEANYLLRIEKELKKIGRWEGAKEAKADDDERDEDEK